MSVLKTKILWFSQQEEREQEETGTNDPVEIQDAINWNPKKGLKSSANTVDINLKNFNLKYINKDGLVKFEQEDVIKVFLKYIDDDDDIDVNSTDDLIMTAFVQGWKGTVNNKRVSYQLKCIDRTYALLSRVWAQPFTRTQAKSSPEIVKDIINSTNDDSGDGKFFINAEFDDIPDKIGFMERKRQDGSDFPIIEFARVMKPIYEWIEDLSTIDNTNTATELDADNPPQNRNMIFWVDEENNFHWIYPTDFVNYYLEEGKIKGDTGTYGDAIGNTIYEIVLEKNTFGVVNFIIYQIGKDMNGSGRLDSFLYPQSKSKRLKGVYRNWNKITEDLLDVESKLNEVGPTITRNTSGAWDYPANYNGYGTGTKRPQWDPGADITSNTTFNDSLVTAAQKKGQERARRLCVRLGSPRWKGKIEVKGINYKAGELIEFTSKSLGIVKQKLRIMTIKHNVQKIGWFTTINVEEDEEVIS